MKKVAVFASGRGSNFEQFCIAQKQIDFPAKIALLIASNQEIGAIDIAKKYNIPHQVFNRKDFPDDEGYNKELIECLESNSIEYIVLAGWLKLIHPELIKQFPERIINIHPALLPFFGGKGMYGMHVHEAVWKSGMLVSGATVHIVDPVYDNGRILMQECVQLEKGDTPDIIARKVLKAEHKIYPVALKLLIENKTGSGINT